MSARRLGWLVATLMGIGCEERNPAPSLPAYAQGLAAVARATGAAEADGNDLTPVEDGEIFDALVEEIRGARESVHILIYIWRGEGDPSERVGRALLERRAGVACRIVLDWWGSLKFSPALEGRLVGSGCEIRRHGPADAKSATNHRKIVVVDGRVALTGGFGIWRSWLGKGKTPDEWRDSNVRIRGPVVAQLQRAFEQSLREAGGAPLPANAYPPLRQEGPYRALFVASSPRQTPTAAEAMTHALVGAARRRLWIANSYFIPDDALQRLLVRKVREGVDVRVLAPGPVHDVALVRAAQRETYAPLLEGGIRIWEYQPSMMHSKILIVDDAIVAIGSTNMDRLSFAHLEEGSLVADAPPVARQLARRFEADLRLASEITREHWRTRDRVTDVGREAAGLLNDWL